MDSTEAPSEQVNAWMPPCAAAVTTEMGTDNDGRVTLYAVYLRTTFFGGGGEGRQYDNIDRIDDRIE